VNGRGRRRADAQQRPARQRRQTQRRGRASGPARASGVAGAAILTASPCVGSIGLGQHPSERRRTAIAATAAPTAVKTPTHSSMTAPIPSSCSWPIAALLWWTAIPPPSASTTSRPARCRRRRRTQGRMGNELTAATGRRARAAYAAAARAASAARTRSCPAAYTPPAPWPRATAARRRWSGARTLGRAAG
jgi:hypothetical protein